MPQELVFSRFCLMRGGDYPLPIHRKAHSLNLRRGLDQVNFGETLDPGLAAECC